MLNHRCKSRIPKNPNQTRYLTVLKMPDSALRVNLCAGRLY